MKFEKNKWVNQAGSEPQIYVGRFAPSPSGPLHLGSLFTALAGFLDARSHQGKWLLRIDDLDEPRNVTGAADSILKTLEKFGLYWDETETYQSRCSTIYEEFLAALTANDLQYRCFCSRKTVAELDHAPSNGIYPGYCRYKTRYPDEPYAIRVKTDHRTINFHDRLQGGFSENISEKHGDFIIKRKDRIFAYQYAVVIDDALQKINQVVRGIDLLDSTAKQIYLQQLLNIPTPDYMHVPVIIDRAGYKLSKQTLATAVDCENPTSKLIDLLDLLKQNPPIELKYATVAEILGWVLNHWEPTKLNGIRTVYQESS